MVCQLPKTKTCTHMLPVCRPSVAMWNRYIYTYIARACREAEYSNMSRSMAVAAALVVLAALHTSSAAGIQRREVSYDGRALIVDGKRTMLFSGEMHYTRSTPEVF